MKNTTTKIATLAVMLAVLLVGVQAVSAESDTEVNKLGEHKQNHQEIREAIEAGDYDAFQEATADRPEDAPEITQEQFDVLVEAHQLKESGDIEAAKELLEEAGIERPRVHKFAKRLHKFREVRADISEAIEAGDYDAFQEATADRPEDAPEITQEQFDVLVEAHQLKESGDIEAAKELLEEAGIERPRKFIPGQKIKQHIQDKLEQ